MALGLSGYPCVFGGDQASCRLATTAVKEGDHAPQRLMEASIEMMTAVSIH